MYHMIMAYYLNRKDPINVLWLFSTVMRRAMGTTCTKEQRCGLYHNYWKELPKVGLGSLRRDNLPLWGTGNKWRWVQLDDQYIRNVWGFENDGEGSSTDFKNAQLIKKWIRGPAANHYEEFRRFISGEGHPYILNGWDRGANKKGDAPILRWKPSGWTHFRSERPHKQWKRARDLCSDRLSCAQGSQNMTALRNVVLHVRAGISHPHVYRSPTLIFHGL